MARNELAQTCLELVQRPGLTIHMGLVTAPELIVDMQSSVAIRPREDNQRTRITGGLAQHQGCRRMTDSDQSSAVINIYRLVAGKAL